jgi:uncharacterized YccA/Bax inhibitor family protein
MQSNNPVFARSQGFNGRGGTAYADFGAGVPSTHTQPGSGRMSIDSVVQKTGITLGVVVLAAAVTWILTGDVVTKDAFGDQNGMPGLVIGAVIGTMGAVAGTLAAYKFFDIQVSTKFRKWVVAAMFGFVAVTMLDFVLHFFGADFGFNGLGTMGLLSSILGLGLGVLMLILDFDFVERGIAAALPERESWRAAFGLTVTLVWIYIELLRILAIFTRR